MLSILSPFLFGFPVFLSGFLNVTGFYGKLYKIDISGQTNPKDRCWVFSDPAEE